MSDYAPYLSFDLPENVGDLYKGHEDLVGTPTQVSPEFQESLSRAFNEMAQTAEGQSLILQAAARGADNQINIIGVEGADSPFVLDGNDIYMPADGSNSAQYFSVDTQEFHDFSVQRMLHHEMVHLAEDHAPTNEAEVQTVEKQTVQQTNDYMEKYFGETRRGRYDSTNNVGTPGMEVNPNFNNDPTHLASEEMRKVLGRVDETDLADKSPEIQSLHELKEHPELFAAQYNELMQTGGMEFAVPDYLEFKDKQMFEDMAREVQAPSIPAFTFKSHEFAP